MLSSLECLIQPVSRAQFAVGAIAKLPKYLKAAGCKSAVIVTDEGLVKAGVIARVQEALEAKEVAYQLFSGVSPNPTTDDVFAGAEVLREAPDAAVVAVGGGSAMDAAKAISLLAPNGGKVTDFYPGARVAHPGQPLIAVPTTAGTGAETNMFAVITDSEKGRKLLVGHPSVHPQASILDPELSVGAPQKVTATCGMDVLTHAIESFTSNRPNPFSEAVALRAIAMVATYLPVAYDDGADVEARSQMLVAAHLAGIAFSSTGLGMCHAMGHPLSARLGVAHGQSLASILPDVMRFNMETSAPRYAQVAIALGVADAQADDENALRAIGAVEAMSARVKTNVPLGELGVTLELIPTLVEDAFADPLMASTPRPPGNADVTGIYEARL